MINTPKIKKHIITALVIVSVLAITYACAWFQLRSTAEGYYADAIKNYQAGKIMESLKGEKVLNENGYAYYGGFEQAVDAFRSSFALPKPEVYYLAAGKIDDIIYKDLTPETGLAIYKKFFRLDNEYLGEILIRAAVVYYSQKNFTDALKTYTLAEDSFPLNKVIADAAREGINKCKTELNLN